MAKWGEGDPRWIVEERPDATNVNNWHWTEKNADAWSKNKLKELFEKRTIAADKDLDILVEALDKCEGEARANNRKAKLIFFYEWDLTLKWSCTTADKSVTGTVSIPNLSEEHTDMKDVDVDVSVTSTPQSCPEARRAKEALRVGDGAKWIRDRLEEYVQALRSEFSQGIIKPKANSAAPAASSSKPAAPTTEATKAAFKNLDLAAQKPAASSSASSSTCQIDLQETFKCTGQELYNALTQKEMLQVFTRAPVVLAETKEGQEFELLGGNVQGKFVKLSPFTRIVQKWRLKNWPDGLFSEVELRITQDKEDTKLFVKQTGVPSKEAENTKMGWNRYYFEAIKRSFGFSNALY